ncbi:MAG: electron transfer flavoprotein subunit alpha/FixB family protein [Deltaproteobacteria bacterium]
MSNNGVLVCGETREGAVDERTLELVGAGKGLASELGVELSVALLGDNISDAADDISFFGVDKVYKLAHPLLGAFSPEIWAGALASLCKQITPNILIMPHSSPWMDVGPRLAFRLDSVLTTDCVHLEIDQADSLLLRTKPVYGGSALAVFKYDKFPQLATVRRNEEAVALDKATVILAGGRGIGGSEGFEELENLVNSFKQSFDEVMIGCSRPVVDSGWLPSSHQIGLSGAMVQPDLYVAVGISGAVQHLAGMARSRKIVAVNTDVNSNIFAVADYGVVDDYKKVIPALKTKWEELARERDKDRSVRKTNS